LVVVDICTWPSSLTVKMGKPDELLTLSAEVADVLPEPTTSSLLVGVFVPMPTCAWILSDNLSTIATAMRERDKAIMKNNLTIDV